MMAAILNSANLNSTIMDSVILVFPLKLTHICQDLIPPFAPKKLDSFILTQLDDGQPSWTLPCWIQTLPSWIQTPCYLLLWFTQKHSHSTLTLNQTNSFWLKLIPSHLTWWWQASWILPSWIRPFCTKLWLKLIQSDSKSFILSQLDDGCHLECCLLAFNHFAQKNFSHSFWLNLMMAAILNSAILDSPIMLKLWLKLIQSDSNSFISLNWWW